MANFQVGDKVRWRNRPYHPWHEGVVERVISRGEIFTNDNFLARSRNQESYAVRSKGHLYWPRTKNLEHHNDRYRTHRQHRM